ncbi:hypothetical protein CFOL_v3_12626 [Cephalotus follicularis]|uniref:Uncharacterized protein n=1 Tax=Cephalotus follicularis TaxID=3775 RepID=A0A1Q3BMC9_CEPFO|nr:hypothetical protein CFOL_v3_12626 [Cephalotus follicularis]
MVVDVPSPYNAILGRPWKNSMDAVVSTRYLAVKFPTYQGVRVVKGDQAAARQCYFSLIKASSKRKETNETLPINSLDLCDEIKTLRSEPVDELIPIMVFSRR